MQCTHLMFGIVMVELVGPFLRELHAQSICLGDNADDLLVVGVRRHISVGYSVSKSIGPVRSTPV